MTIEDATPSPRETRLRLLKMELWFRKNADSFAPEDQMFLRAALEWAEKSGDADVIADALRAGIAEALATAASTEGWGAPE